MPDMSLFDVLDRLSSLTRMWFRQHPLLVISSQYNLVR